MDRYREADRQSDLPLMSNGISGEDLDYDGVEVETGLREPPLLIRWEGYLMKRSDWLKHWDTYYFVLHGRVLYCYLSEEEAKLHPESSKIKHGKFSISDSLILDEVFSVRSRHHYEFIFENDQGKQIYLRAKTEASKQMWMHMASHGIVDNYTDHDQALNMRRAPQRHATLVDFFLGYEYLFASLSNIEDAAMPMASSSSLDSFNKYLKSHGTNAPTIILPDAAIAEFPPKVDHILCRFFSMCHTDIAMRNNYMPIVPFQGTFRGYAGILEYFTKLSKAVVFKSFNVEGMSFEGEGSKRLVVVQGHETMEVRGTGEALCQAWVQKFLIKDDGRIYRYGSSSMHRRLRVVHRWEINGDIVASSVAFKHLHVRGVVGAEKFREMFTTIKLDNIPNLARKDKHTTSDVPLAPQQGQQRQPAAHERPPKHQPKMVWSTPPQHSTKSPTEAEWKRHDKRVQTSASARQALPATIQFKRIHPSSSPATHELSPTAQADELHSPFEDRPSTFLENDGLGIEDEPEREDHPMHEEAEAPRFQGTSQLKTSFLSNASSLQDDAFSVVTTAATAGASNSFSNPTPPRTHTATTHEPAFRQTSLSAPTLEKSNLRGLQTCHPSSSQSCPSPFPHYAPPRPFQSASHATPSHHVSGKDSSPSHPNHSRPRQSSRQPAPTTSSTEGEYGTPSPNESSNSPNAPDDAITSSTSFDYPLGFKRGNLWPDAPVPPSESIRIQVAKRLDLCRPRDDLTMYLNIACKTLHVPMGTVCVVGGAAGLFVAKVGMMQVDTVPRDVIFESHVIMSAEPTVVLDTNLDIRFALNPLVTQGDIRFYVGIPLVTSDNVVLGALSLVDKVPRAFVRKKELSTLVQIAQTIVNRAEDLIAASSSKQAVPDHMNEMADRRKQMDLEVD
ncbi:hypothetical protein DYB32_000438 [Aphanomyces invadans]|uniref:PH domain-containing protein n=1 Tax=Aphanomyces invadans TaxID=157072 RepID=A0A418B9Z8_9STRA|nr:hypothetical protein DYB32_000438 [Aphanomyces invadans]